MTEFKNMQQRIEATRATMRSIQADPKMLNEPIENRLEHAVARFVPRRYSRLIQLLQSTPELLGDTIDDDDGGGAVRNIGDAIMTVVSARLRRAALEEYMKLTQTQEASAETPPSP